MQAAIALPVHLRSDLEIGRLGQLKAESQLQKQGLERYFAAAASCRVEWLLAWSQPL